MNNKKFALKTTKEGFFKSYLQILNGIAGLSKDELGVLSALMDIENVEDFDLVAVRAQLGLTERSFKKVFNNLIKMGLIEEHAEGEYRINDNINVTRGTVQITFELRVV